MVQQLAGICARLAVEPHDQDIDIWPWKCEADGIGAEKYGIAERVIILDEDANSFEGHHSCLQHLIGGGVDELADVL